MMIYPGQIWRDTNGVPIQAHGGCILRVADEFYWYGEDKTGKTSHYRVDVVGIHAYRSKNLTDWTDCGLVLAGSDDPNSDLFRKGVVERPKVLFNEKTGRYVMWMHIDDSRYWRASVGVAVADSPVGPFEYRGAFRPTMSESRDMTLFQDKDGAAYLLFSSDQNRTMRIARLTDDYLALDGTEQAIFIDQTREAPVMYYHDGRYFMLTSGCTGWLPNPSLVAVADCVMGRWRLMDNPFEGSEKETSFRTQGTWMFNVPGTDMVVYMGDRWNPNDLQDSRYVWLPVEWQDGRMRICWRDAWDMPDVRG